jgi:hypothetical protein
MSDRTSLVEQERGYRLTSSDRLPELLNVVWPPNHVANVDGTCLFFTGAHIRRSLHLFSPQTQDSFKSRLRVHARGKKLEVIQEEKILTGGLKLEKKLADTTKAKEIVKVLRRFEAVSSAIAKERLSISYIGLLGDLDAKQCTLTISIDKILPFSFDDPQPLSPPIYDIDIDGDGTGSEKRFVATAFFRQNIADKVRPLDIATSKWRLGVTVQPFSLKGVEYGQFDSRVRAALDLLNESTDETSAPAHLKVAAS